MRDKKFYVIIPEVANMLGSEYKFYTTHEELMVQFFSQYKNENFNVLEFVGDNIIEIAEECLIEYMIDIEPERDKLQIYDTGEGYSFISSDNYIEQIQDSMSYNNVQGQIIKKLVSDYLTLFSLRKYVKPHLRKDYELYMTLVYKYICRMVLSDSYDLNDLAPSVKELLSITVDDYISPEDIINHNLILYYEEFEYLNEED